MKCEIQWIDDNGNLTPDDNEAVGYVYRAPYLDPEDGYQFVSTKLFPICRNHLAEMIQKRYRHWVYVPFEYSKGTKEAIEDPSQFPTGKNASQG
jgi:hypothetical protein